MKNSKIYFVKYSYEKREILDENFDYIMTDMISKDIDFELALVNEYNITDTSINVIINKYISECKKPGEKRNFAVLFNIDSKDYSSFPICVRMLLKGLITHYEDFNYLRNTDEYHLFDVFIKYSGFKVLIPKNLVSDDEYNKFLYLGPDYIFACFLDNAQIFEYILPAYYQFLFENGLFKDKVYNNLSSYKIGLA